MSQTQAAEFVIVDSTELRTLSADSKSIRCSPLFFYVKLPPSVFGLSPSPGAVSSGFFLMKTLFAG